MNINRRRRNKGFTLIEVLVVTAISGLLFLGVVTIFNSGQAIWDGDMGLVELQEQSRQAMAGMIREIRQASSVNLVSAQDINFSTPDSGSSFIRYFLSGSQILREYPKDSGASIVLANNINSLSFSSSVNTVEIQLKAQKIVRGRTLVFPITGNLIERVDMRN